jgi:hypothetical protein
MFRLLATGADGSAHQTMYNRLCEEANVIVWSCGYHAHIPYDILNEEGEAMPIYKVRGQVELDDQARVLATSSITNPMPTPIKNLYATGLGFGLNVSGDTQEISSSKADGVEVYLRRAATVILSHVIGTKVFGEGCKTWDQHCAENWKRILAAQIASRAARRGEGGGEEDVEIEYSKVFASPTPASRSKRGHMSPAGSSPIPHSPIRRNAKTAEPRSRATKGISNVRSPQPAASRGNRAPLHNIPPSPLRKASMPTAPVENRRGVSAGGRALRSLSSGNPLMIGNIPPDDTEQATAELASSPRSTVEIAPSVESSSVAVSSDAITVDASCYLSSTLTLPSSDDGNALSVLCDSDESSPPPEYSDEDMPKSSLPTHLQVSLSQDDAEAKQWSREVNMTTKDVVALNMTRCEFITDHSETMSKTHNKLKIDPHMVKCDSEGSRDGSDLMAHLQPSSVGRNTTSIRSANLAAQQSDTIVAAEGPPSSPILRPASFKQRRPTSGGSNTRQRATTSVLSSSLPLPLTGMLLLHSLRVL